LEGLFSIYFYVKPEIDPVLKYTGQVLAHSQDQCSGSLRYHLIFLGLS